MSEPINEGRVRLLVDALRSGRFRQGHDRLTTIMPEGGEADCCLGVACKVAMANGLKVKTDVIEFRNPTLASATTECVTYDGAHGILPKSVMEWFGFNSENPHLHFSFSRRSNSAAVCNDELGCNFERIADGFEFTFLGGKS